MVTSSSAILLESSEASPTSGENDGPRHLWGRGFQPSLESIVKKSCPLNHRCSVFIAFICLFALFKPLSATLLPLDSRQAPSSILNLVTSNSVTRRHHPLISRRDTSAHRKRQSQPDAQQSRGIPPASDPSDEFKSLTVRRPISQVIRSNADLSGSDKSESRPHDVVFAIQAVLIPLLVILSGIFAGLTLGYMSLDATQLIVLSKSGTPQQQAYAKKIAPLRKDGRLLLITLLIANMIANEALPVVSENVLGGGVQAIIVSTVLVIIFSEIIPQSVCATHGLQVGAFCAKPVKVLMFLFYPLAWPIAKFLTRLLGEHSGVIYRRPELKELVNLHGQQGAHGGDLADDVVTIVRGALDLQERVVADSMRPLESCFMLNIETKLDFQNLSLILQSGHSRIPVYENIQTLSGQSRRKIVGALLTKQLILVDPDDGLPLRDFPLNPLPIVSSDMPLLNILNCFQEGRSHLALVGPPRPPPPFSPRVSASGDGKPPQSPLNQLSALSPGSETKPNRLRSVKSRRWRPWLMLRPKDAKQGAGEDATRKAYPTGDEESELGRPGNGHTPYSPPKAPSGTFLKADSLPTTNRIDLDAMDSGETSEPLGIISLEDVLEQLLGEPIYDETDPDESGRAAVRPYVPPEAVQALQITHHGLIDAEKKGHSSDDRCVTHVIPLPISVIGDRGMEKQVIDKGIRFGEIVDPSVKVMEEKMILESGRLADWVGVGCQMTTEAREPLRDREAQEKDKTVDSLLTSQDASPALAGVAISSSGLPNCRTSEAPAAPCSRIVEFGPGEFETVADFTSRNHGSA